MTGRVAAVERGLPPVGKIEPGDRLVAVDGKRGQPADLSRAIAAHGCPRRPPVDGCRAAEPAEVVVEREGREIRLELTPVYDAEAGKTRLGFRYAQDGPRRPLPVGQAVDASWRQFWFIARETALLPTRLLDAERRREISSVVGTYEVTRQTIINNIAQTVLVLAVVSLSLAIVNLFPFLPLDGGHIFWSVVEKMRRRPVPYSVMERAGVVGFALVIGLFLIGLSNDIDRLTGEGFNVR